MDHIQQAQDYHDKRFNCAQSVLAPFAERFGLAEETALKIACGFGAGMGRMQEVCGAAAGAFMVIGLQYGMSKSHEEALKDLTYEKVRQFSELFMQRHGSINCRKLLDVDLLTRQGMEYARANNLFSNRCALFVRDAVEIVRGLI